jgi:dTDP-4-amino-4,6-dideoxygalactose transaminase
VSDRSSAWHLYVVELGEPVVRSRVDVFTAMRAAGVGVAVHYIPVHLQPYYRALGFKAGDYPAAETYYGRCLTLPLYPTLTPAQQSRVVEALQSAVSG